MNPNFADEVQKKQAAAKAAQDAHANQQKNLRGSDAIQKAVIEGAKANIKHRAQHEPKVEVKNLPQDLAKTGDLNHVVDSINKMNVTTFMSNSGFQEMATTMQHLQEEVRNVQRQLADQGLTSMSDNFKALVTRLEAVSKALTGTKVNLDSGVTQSIDALKTAIDGMDFNPQVHVAAPEAKVVTTPIDLKPVITALGEVKQAIKDSESSEAPDDYTPITDGLASLEDTFKNLRFPSSNFILPFKKTSGAASQVQLDASGNVPVTVSGGTGGTQYTDGAVPPANPIGNALVFGDQGDNTWDYVSLANGLPTSPLMVPADFYPAYNNIANGGLPLRTDATGSLAVGAAVTTDQGSGRGNWTGSAISFSPGSATFVNGSTALTGTGFSTQDIHYLDFIKLSADPEADWVQVIYVNSDTSITLSAPYPGTSATGAFDIARAITSTGAGATISVASGQLTLAAGTTNASASAVYKVLTFPPFQNVTATNRISISQRIANQDIYVGLEQKIASSRYFVRFHFSGTTNTQVITESGYNPTGVPSAAETETNTVTLPTGATTASLNVYKVDYQYDQAIFSINGVIVATHSARLPQIWAQNINNQIRVVNNAIVTNTNIINDYMFTRSYSRIDTYPSGAAPINLTSLNGLTISTSNPLPTAQIAPIGNGFTSTHYISANTTNATSVKGSPGDIGGIQAYNNTATIGYLKLYDKASAPTVGTDIPVKTILIPANTSGAGTNISFASPGVSFINGIAFAITGSIGDADTTVVAANAFVINLDSK
jgi:hypothetical protein